MDNTNTSSNGTPTVPDMGNPLAAQPVATPAAPVVDSAPVVQAPEQPITPAATTVEQVTAPEPAASTPQTSEIIPQETVSEVPIQPPVTPQEIPQPLAVTEIPTPQMTTPQQTQPLSTPKEEQVAVPPTLMPVDTALPQNTGADPVPPPAKSTKLGLAIGITFLIALIIGGSVYYYFFMYTKQAVATVITTVPTVATTTSKAEVKPAPAPVLPPIDIATQIKDEAESNANDDSLSASSTDDFIAESNAK